MPMDAIQLVLSDTFTAAQERLPQQIAHRVWDTVRQIRDNPQHPSLNYERINDASSKRIRSVRVTDDYRIILAHPDGDGIYLLLWVDKHDAAYDWARRHKLDYGIGKRGLAIIPVETHSPLRVDGIDTFADVHSPADSTSLLAHCRDADLERAGVPAMFIEPLRACRDEGALLAALSGLRTEVGEAVMALVLGEPLPAPTATNMLVTLAEALAQPESQQRFLTITSEHELQQALEYPLERWRTFLHHTQRAIVTRNYSGPALVSGGAGTGKTVVGIHRAYHLAHNVFTAPTDRILLTTFTRNLAENLDMLMTSFCGADAASRQRIEVAHIHALAAQLRRQAGEKFTIVPERMVKAFWQQALQHSEALGFPSTFYENEWKKVVQERDALTADAYESIDRSGRGRPLARRQRHAIWPVFAAYRRQLVDQGYEEWPDIIRRATELVSQETVTLPFVYRAAIIDEAQDFTTQELRLLDTLIGQGPNSLMLMGDSRQQIYQRGSAVKTINMSIGRRHTELRTNYRTTAQISAAAESIVQQATTLAGERLARHTISLLSGPEPVIHVSETEEDENAFILATIHALQDTYTLSDVAILAHSATVIARVQRELAQHKIGTKGLDQPPADDVIPCGTIHRAKGLEFRVVLVVGCTQNPLIAKTGQDESEDDDSGAEERERHLLYVAMTRARERLYISSAQPMSTLIGEALQPTDIH